MPCFWEEISENRLESLILRTDRVKVQKMKKTDNIIAADRVGERMIEVTVSIVAFIEDVDAKYFSGKESERCSKGTKEIV